MNFRKHFNAVSWLGILFLLAFIPRVSFGQVPHILNYQGKINVGGTPFTGTGQFRFALVDAAGTTSFWSNDGTSTAGSEPTAAVMLPVVNGLYVVPLGDTAIANMLAVPTAAFDHPEVRLRVWFNDGSKGSQRLAPDQRINAVAYAMVADSVANGSVGSSKLQPDLQIPGQFTAGSFAGNGSQLTNINTGTTFIRWGNTTAPEGTTLLYSGVAFSGFYGHTGASTPVVIPPGVAGENRPFTSGSVLYPMITLGLNSNPRMPTGITEGKIIQAAVCFTSSPCTVIWGTWSPPSGWRIAYKGYAMGSFPSSQAGFPLMCIDSDAFDSTQSAASLGNSGGFVVPAEIELVPAGMGYTPRTFVKCAVILKNP